MSQKKIYLDYNATTPLESEVITTITEALTDAWGNPSSSHNTGKTAKGIIDQARSDVASLIGTKSSDVVFTSGGTEADNMIIMTVVKHFNKEKMKNVTEKNVDQSLTGYINTESSKKRHHLGEHGCKIGSCDTDEEKYELPHIISSRMEHPAVNVFLEHLKDTAQAVVTYASLSPLTGRLEVENVLHEIKPNTILVTVMLANNETGIIQPVKEICDAVRNIKRGNGETKKIFVHTDAAQALGKVPVDVATLGVDYLTVVGHKYYGPRIGAVYAKDLENRETPLYPFFFGGGQERNFRPGTENTGMIAGLGKASEIAFKNIVKFETDMSKCRDYLEEKLVEAFGKRVHFNGKFAQSERLPNTCNVSILGNNCEGHKVLAKCKVLQASVGAACHAQNKPSAILLAVGVPEDIARHALRLSVGRYTTIEDIDLVVEDLKQAVQMLADEA
ncbi:selenocysteine lyase-like isoform X1 [Mya arenaria]|uniref:selenocysteine lyase-like isoform X1 n=1 Tax=Mya arenaria TaxID=6604 RepID=UPI0022E2D2A0|nr:selenocysteine lyase-like isoform X1 [Mya arenaria]